MNPNDLSKVTALRARLHACPELSGREDATLGALHDFLSENTTLALERRDGWLLATHWEGDGLSEIGLRADVDAIPAEGEPGAARHGCGHDGHSAILCGVALAMEGRRLGRNLRLIFQGGEEDGTGARHICETWPELGGLRRVYGLHNLPGQPLGAVCWRRGCFACASAGLILRVQGRPAHAAYPEQGANPAPLLSRLVLALPGMVRAILAGDDRLLMATVVGLRLGGERFGLSASEGQLCLTLRGHRQADIDALAESVRRFAREGCDAEGMTCAFETRDAFPDTTSDGGALDEALARWARAGVATRALPEPMRWSEGFGWYLRRVPGAFFGVGAGEDCPGLHTGGYSFPDAVIPFAVDAFLALLA